MQLLNSGRGIEAWLEPSNSAPIETNSEFIISHGPLSYAYKLFKIELHSAANFPSQQIASPRARNNHAGSHAHPYKGDQKENSDLLAEEQVPEALKSGKSSEHLINGDSFEAELQLHFYNRHLASSSAQALQLAFESRPNLFATISVFIVTTKVKNNHQSGNNENNKKEKQQTANNNQSSPIDFILDNLNVIPNQGNLVELKLTRKHIESLITDRNHYITYQGSMNRPPCAENVDWILLNKAIKIDETKLEVIFEKLTTNQENIRPVKALHRRLLRTTISKLEFVPSTKENSASECGDDKQRRVSLELGELFWRLSRTLSTFYVLSISVGLLFGLVCLMVKLEKLEKLGYHQSRTKFGTQARCWRVSLKKGCGGSGGGANLCVVALQGTTRNVDKCRYKNNDVHFSSKRH